MMKIVKKVHLIIPKNAIEIDNSDLDIYQTYLHTLNLSNNI